MNSAKDVDFSKHTNSVRGGMTVRAIGLAAAFAAYASGTTRAARTGAKPTRTTQDGVYTDEQAKKGKTQ